MGRKGNRPFSQELETVVNESRAQKYLIRYYAIFAVYKTELIENNSSHLFVSFSISLKRRESASSTQKYKQPICFFIERPFKYLSKGGTYLNVKNTANYRTQWYHKKELAPGKGCRGNKKKENFRRRRPFKRDKLHPASKTARGTAIYSGAGFAAALYRSWFIILSFLHARRA